MGSSSSKFRKHIQSGDEYAAIHLYSSSSDLRKALDPNLSYGDSYNHDTPMHMVARHAMKSLLRIFLCDLGGNPNKKNGRSETVLHCVCAGSAADQSYAQKLRRDECLLLVLQWNGTRLADGSMERVELIAKDENENTALHFAAMAGLQRCVELLVSFGASLFVENGAKETPCDCAEKHGYAQIALYLESKMVFSNEDENVDEFGILLTQLESDEGYSGLRAQDLQEAKDQLLVETSDMLHVPLFTAEALLRNHEWSREMLLESWIADAVVCCEKCGVVPPSAVVPDYSLQPRDTDAGSAFSLPLPMPQFPCNICDCNIPAAEDPVVIACDHHFCRSCWEMYLTVKITEGETHHITCPGFGCSMLVPVEIIEKLVSREMARRYLQFDIKAFVESNPSIKWCPYPACGRAVRLPDSDNPMSPLFRTNSGGRSPADTSHAVDCGNGHIFCWECLGEAHEPASCENWKNWHQKIGNIKPEELHGTEEETENSANCLWLVTNSKPCPNCKSPIQKNEGCNHMKCSKCKYDFCWVCLEAWKKHSTATGGYFRCNRYEVVKKVEDSHDLMKTEVEAKNKKLQELNRFVHYYSRFKNHENSYKLEMLLYDTAKDKMMVLARAVSERHDSSTHETKFVQDAITQLLKARHVLKCSYVYGYYLEEVGYKKPIFEFMQTELEECTETLSEMVARPYLRTPRTKIVQTAHLVQRKRHELVAAIAKGLVPPDTSPAAKKKKNFHVDDDTRRALLASLQDDPLNPWVKDISSGRNPVIPALLDWPEASDESDSEASPLQIEGASLSAPSGNDVDLSQVSLEIPGFAGFGMCARSGCLRRRAVNQLTGQLHDHCSIDCMRQDQAAEPDSNTAEENAVLAQTSDIAELLTDYQIDLLRALEMSRLQFLREIGSLRPGTSESRSPSESSPAMSPRLSSSPRARTARSCSSQLLDVDWTSDRHVSGSRSLGTSPRPSTSSDVDPVLAVPHTGQHALSQELDHSVEMSQLNLRDEDQAVCLAIALSIQDTAGSSAGLPSSCVTSMARPVSNSALGSCSCQYLSEQDGFAQTMDRPETLSSVCGSSLNSSHKLMAHVAAHCGTSRHEYDFPRSLVAGEGNIENVFEPRPPHPLSSPQPARSGKRCALAHDETITVLDPWHRRPSSLDHGRHKSHCTRLAETCGITSNKSKSSSRRRRSCGSHLPYRNPPDVGYLSDRTISPVPSSTDRAASTVRASVSRDLHPPTDSLDLVISSDILESMLQGAEGYCAEAAGQAEASSCTGNMSMEHIASKDDCDSVFL